MLICFSFFFSPIILDFIIFWAKFGFLKFKMLYLISNWYFGGYLYEEEKKKKKYVLDSSSFSLNFL